MITAYGMACGLAMNTAHELGHRNGAIEQLMSKFILLTTFYMHFFIEHNRGHHMNVATDEDPGSSRYGENIYSFYFRAIGHGWASAWSLERGRLHKSGQSLWSIQNEMLVFTAAQLSLLVAILTLFGIHIMLYYLAAAFIGILMLETVNYIEHYGLRRKKNGRRYERTLPIHSWNSNHPLGRMVLLELSRHSDHHFISNRKFQLLRHFDESPQMPTGYPGMMLLALVPPLWFKVMHKQIDNYQALFKAQEMGDGHSALNLQSN
jgi:alkane 1-monooxygenase